jgi:hypothetical protein
MSRVLSPPALGLEGVHRLSTTSEARLRAYRRACGWSLARTQARSGYGLAIATDLGAGSVFDDAIACFSPAYADQNELGYRCLVAAVADGEIHAEVGI